jgi:hypothetical protein
MSRIVTLSEAEQDVILLQLYDLASRHAAERVRASRRDDLVQDLALKWLERLRNGTWDVPAEQFDAFVLDAVQHRRTADRPERQAEKSVDTPMPSIDPYLPTLEGSLPTSAFGIAIGPSTPRYWKRSKRTRRRPGRRHRERRRRDGSGILWRRGKVPKHRRSHDLLD